MKNSKNDGREEHNEEQRDSQYVCESCAKKSESDLRPRIETFFGRSRRHATHWSEGHGINESGDVTGWAYLVGMVHAFRFSNGTMQDLGTLPGGTNSVGFAINNSGQVTGYASTSAGILRAFLFSNGTMQNLNGLIPPNSGWTLQTGADINDRGQIAGFGSLDSREHAFLLTPVGHHSAPDHTLCHAAETLAT